MKKEKLTPRQWRLYELLKDFYNKNPNGYLTTNDILEALPNDYYYLKTEMENGTPLHDCQCQYNIRGDINALRNSDQINKIICSSPKGYKIATEREADSWLHRIKNEGIAKLRMYWKNRKSAEANNQLTLVFNYEKGIIEVFDK